MSTLTRYELALELVPPHASDVKAVIAVGHDRIITASRDSSVGVWQRSQTVLRFFPWTCIRY